MDLRPFYNRFSHLSHSFSLFPRLTSVERVECGVRGEEEKAERATNSGVRLDDYDTVWVYYGILYDSGIFVCSWEVRVRQVCLIDVRSDVCIQYRKFDGSLCSC